MWIQLDDREHATVLAALRYWQRCVTNSKFMHERLPESDIATDAGKLDPIWPDEIDTLCERINTEYSELAPESTNHKPLVLVTVDGGVAYPQCEIPGTALVALYDFDNNDVSAEEDKVILPELADGKPDWAAIRRNAEAGA